MSTWLNRLKSETLRYWLQETSTPMLATLFDGSVLWSNAAFEELVGYTSSEFADADNPVTWIDMTVDRGDVHHDLEMAEQVKDGRRKEYQLNKQYRTKWGQMVDVVIHVLRHPAEGPFEAFLVSVSPLGQGAEFALKEIGDLRSMQLKMFEILDRHPTSHGTFWRWAQANPKLSIPAGLVVSSMMFGEKIFELLERAIELLRNVATGG